MPDIHTRLNVARFSERGNCVSTAFYLVGLIDNHEASIDTLAEAEVIGALLSRCRLSDVPLPGCLIAWHYPRDSQNRIAHLGLVSTMAPLLVTHRPGFYRPLEESVPLEAIDLTCSDYPLCEKRYYTPPQRT